MKRDIPFGKPYRYNLHFLFGIIEELLRKFLAVALSRKAPSVLCPLNYQLGYRLLSTLPEFSQR